jgi:hypothetical protein
VFVVILIAVLRTSASSHNFWNKNTQVILFAAVKAEVVQEAITLAVEAVATQGVVIQAAVGVARVE